MAAACGGNKENPFDIPAGGAGGGPVTPITATVKGKIAFEGTPPTPKKLSTASDPNCKNTSLVSEEIVVSDGGLENVILYVSGGDLAGKSFAPATQEKLLDQQGCHYIPHALTLQVGQPLKIHNSDETAHNVHAWAMVNMPFNESQSSKGVETTKKFDKEEIIFPVRCDVHNWMNAYIGVFNHPLHTVSGKGGAFELKLPAGTYEVTAIHETLGQQKGMVTVAENGSADLNLTFKPK
jgi:plastocyanin